MKEQIIQQCLDILKREDIKYELNLDDLPLIPIHDSIKVNCLILQIQTPVDSGT